MWKIELQYLMLQRSCYQKWYYFLPSISRMLTKASILGSIWNVWYNKKQSANILPKIIIFIQSVRHEQWSANKLSLYIYVDTLYPSYWWYFEIYKP